MAGPAVYSHCLPVNSLATVKVGFSVFGVRFSVFSVQCRAIVLNRFHTKQNRKRLRTAVLHWFRVFSVQFSVVGSTPEGRVPEAPEADECTWQYRSPAAMESDDREALAWGNRISAEPHSPPATILLPPFFCHSVTIDESQSVTQRVTATFVERLSSIAFTGHEAQTAEDSRSTLGRAE